MDIVSSRQVPPGFYENYNADQFFFLFKTGSNPAYYGPPFCYRVPILFLCRALCTHLRSLLMASQLHVAAVSGSSPSTAAPSYLPVALDLLLDAHRGHICHVLDGPNFRIGPNLSLSATPLHIDLDSWAPVGPVDDNTVLIAPPTSDLPFHALVVSGDRTRVTLLRFVTLTEARGGWSNADYEFGPERGRGSIRATVEAFSKVLSHMEEV